MRKKQYFDTYMKVLEQGSYRNNLIRAMYAGPCYVGKSSIMKLFTQQDLVNHQSSTQIVDESDIMVDLEVYGIYDRRLYDLSHILDANIKAIIASLVNTQETIQHHRLQPQQILNQR
ncbi:hypothetical protein TrispH2_011754 [Trichoplax sp. H2]|nr:hypothetical protein TrispH2_011754 [Trichoplax sp. H2]|eukprot:RDD35942.1 hypothetical protein TrispH2_011754 [Trichoplax sp. H2]